MPVYGLNKDPDANVVADTALRHCSVALAATNATATVATDRCSRNNAPLAWLQTGCIVTSDCSECGEATTDSPQTIHR